MAKKRRGKKKGHKAKGHIPLDILKKRLIKLSRVIHSRTS